MMSEYSISTRRKEKNIGSEGCANFSYKYSSEKMRLWKKRKKNLSTQSNYFLTRKKMSDSPKDKNIDDDSLLLLLRDAIVQHSPLNDIKLILR